MGFVEPVSGDLDYEKYPIGSMLFILPWHVRVGLLYTHYMYLRVRCVTRDRCMDVVRRFNVDLNMYDLLVTMSYIIMSDARWLITGKRRAAVKVA